MEGLVVVGHDGSDKRPFFQQHVKIKPVKVGDTSPILSQYPLPSALHEMYTFYDNATDEYYLGEWTFMSLNAISTRATPTKIDFALRYAGMGYVTVCALDVASQRVYERIDGGSNALSRQDSAKSAHILHEPTYTFDEWLETITT
mgnify:CR=1 FL=1